MRLQRNRHRPRPPRHVLRQSTRMSVMLIESRIQKSWAPALLPRVMTMTQPFLSSLWTVALLLGRGRKFFQSLALTHCKLLFSNYSWLALSCCNSVTCSRSSNDESSGSLVERDRFQFRCHDSTLEETADLQEKEAEDATLKDLLKPLPPPKKSTAEADFILVSSSGEPSGSKHHVSPKILSLCI
jgi:hypothetical protein